MNDAAHIDLMRAVARRFFGDPNKQLSKNGELRFGAHGSKSVDLKNGIWYDHEACQGGGPLDLIRINTGLDEARACYAWAEQQGLWINKGNGHTKPNGSANSGRRQVIAYDYVDEGGALLFQVVRYAPKDFRQRRPDGGGGFVWSTKDVRRVVYRLPDITEAIANERPIFIVEGEKDVDECWRTGLPATCNPGGAGKWQDGLTATFAGADVVIIADNDVPGRTHADDVARKLSGTARRVRVLDLGTVWPQCTEGGDISDWIEAGGDAATLYAIVDRLPDWREPAAPKDDPADAVEPIDLWGQFDPPPLPSGLLPAAIEAFAREEAELMGVDPGGLAMAALAVCAAAIPDHVQIQVKRHDPHWRESARLWVALIGNPSTKKSPIMQRAADPLKRLDAALWRSYAAQRAVYDELPREKRKDADRPKQKRLRLEDTTIEAAQEVLRDSPDGVLCIQDELSGWFGAMDKYSGRGAAKDRAFWLQAFNGGTYAVNRVQRGACMIENLSVSLLGGIQPDPMRQVADQTVDDGLLQRLCPVLVQQGSAGKDVPSLYGAGARYDALVGRLQALGATPTPVQFDAGALVIRERLERHHLDLQGCEIVNRKLAAHIGKYDGIFARLCLVWHRVEETAGETVTAHTAQRVADFMRRFLLPHATAFYAGVLALSDDHDRLTGVASYILAKKLERVTNRDVQRGTRAMRGLGRHDIEGVFDQLAALGWITRAPGPRSTDPPHWLVNPVVHRRFVERAAAEAARLAEQHTILMTMFKGER